MKKNKILRKIANWHKLTSNDDYISRHTEIERFNFPKTFYFKYCPCSLELHWAIIKEVDNKFKIYFINDWGRVFDELEFKKKKIAQRQLRKNGFDFSTNRFCPFIPPEPIYIQLSKGKKSAPYSKGNLWKKVQRNKKHFDKLEKNYLKNIIKLRKIKLKKQEYKLLTIGKKQNICIKKEIAHKARIKNFRFHDLRHTVASRLVNAGVPLPTVKKVMTHSDISTTMRYVHTPDEEMFKAMEVLNSCNKGIIQNE